MDKYAQLASLFTPAASTGTSDLDKLFGLRPITDEELAARRADRDARIAELLGEEQGVGPSGTAKIPELSGSAKERAEQIAPAVRAASEKHKVPFDLLMGMTQVESGFNPAATSKVGAMGTAQFMPATAKQYGLSNPRDPVAAADAQARYMRDLLDMFGGDETKAIAAYNAGQGTIQRAKGIPNMGYVNSVQAARSLYGQGPAIQSPAGSPADQLLPAQPQVDPNRFDLVTLTDGSQAYFEKGMSPEEMMGKLTADGVNALPTRPFKTPSGESVLVQYDMSDDEALKTIGAQAPELVQRPRGLPAEEDKSGFLAAAKKGAISGTGTVALGLGDIGQYAAEKLGPESTIGKYAGEFGQAAHQYGEEAQKRAEEAFKMPEDASWLAKNIGYPFMETAGQTLPYVAASVVPGTGLVKAASMGTALLGGAYGQAEQKAKEVGKPFDFEEATPTALADATLNYFGQYVFGPLKGMFGPEAVQAPQAFVRGLVEKEGIEGAKAKMGSMVTDVLKNAGITGGAEIANEVAEDMLYRGYGDQDIFSPEALQSYIETAKQVAPFGVGMGGIHGVAQRSAKVEALTREEEQKAAAEAEAAQISREQEMHLAEDMKSARVNYEKLGIEAPDALSFQDRRQAFDTLMAEREAAQEERKAALPEDLRELPIGEAELLQKARGEQEKYYAPLGLPERGKNIAVKRRALDQLDISNPAHATAINQVLDEIEASNIPHNVEGMKALRQQLVGVPYAEQIPETGAPYGGSSAQPGLREEGRDQAISGEGVEQGGQRIEAPEIQAQEEVKPLTRAEFGQRLGMEEVREDKDLDLQWKHSPDLAASVKAGDVKGTLDVLAQNPSPLIRHIAENARRIKDITLEQNAQKIGGKHAAHWDFMGKELIVRPKFAGHAETIAHEFGHALVHHAVEAPTPEQAPHVEKLKGLYEQVKNDPVLKMKGYARKKEYGAKNLHEFISEGMSNPEFQYRLSQIKVGNTTAWGKFTQMVAKLLGIKDHNALTEFMTHADNLISGVHRGEPTRGMYRYGAKYGVEVKEPEKVDKAYHAGDLGYGSDTGLGRMSGSRGTGHFGTGVYFVGDKTKIGGREDRPMHEIDFSEYNLARPDTETDAQGLHEGLRIINRLVDQVKDGKLQLQHEKFPEFKSDEGHAVDEAASKIRYALMPKKNGKFVQSEDIAALIKKHVEERASVRDTVANRSVYEDTAATRVMKDLGYEGVDVRHLPKFDNADYGSVIYKESLAPEVLKTEVVGMEPKEDLEPPTPTPEEQKKLVEEAKKSGLTSVAEKGGLGSAVGSMMSDMANKGILLPFQTAVFDERAPIANALNRLGANVGKKLRGDLIWGAYSQRFNTIQQAINSGYTVMGRDGTLEAINDSQLAPQQIFDRVRKYGKQLGMSEGNAWKVVSEMLVRLRAGTIREQDAKTRQDAQSYLSAADELDAHASTRTTSDEKRKFKEAANKLRRQAQDKLDSIGDDGRTYVTQEEVEAGRKLYMAYKDTLSREVDNIHELLKKIPDKLEAAGMIDAKTAKQYRDYPFYFPFYDRAKFDEEVLDPLKEETLQRYLGGMGRGLKSVAEVKRQESHGHTIYTADNLLRHLMYWDSAVAEHGARTATCEQLEMTGGATRLMGEPSDKNFVVKVKRDGKDTYYKIHDPNVYYAFQASAPITGPIVDALRKMSRFQRGVAVFNPLFWYKQLIRDPKQVSRIGKVGMITPIDALGELTKIVAGKSKGYERIVAKGVVGPVDIGSNPHERIRSLVQGKGFSTKIYNKLNEIHEAVDAATRAIVYNRALEKYKKWGIGEDVADALAIKDAREVMNFSRKGKNQHLNLLRSVTPFLGSYINSIDVLLKAMSPETYGKLSKADAMEMRRAFLGISSSIATLSLGYSLLMSDDEEWVNNSDRNGNILIRNPFSNKKEKPFIMLPLEFEVGWLQHTLPENMLLANLGAVAPTTEKANLKESAAKALMPPMDFFSYARPLITAALQYEDSRALGADKKGYEGLKQFQDERATEFSKMLADELEKSGIQMFSPNDIDKYMNDFFGGYWSVAQSASSYMLAHRESGAVAPAKTMTEMLPWFGKAFSGEYRDVAVRDAFKVLENVQQVQNTFSRIKATKNLSKYNEFVADPEFVKAVQADKALNGLSERMSKVSTKIATVIADESIKDPKEKRNIIDGLNQEREDIAREVLKRAKAAGVFE